jgi:hypothetical protein
VRDEDLLRKVAKEGKVKIGGQEFSIKPSGKPKIEEGPYNSEWHREYMGTFADDRVRPPDFLVGPNPTVKIDSFYAQPKPAQERPEVQLREGIRAALRAGLSQEKIKEIFELELVAHVMES